jgi:hypothetical protein
LGLSIDFAIALSAAANNLPVKKAKADAGATCTTGNPTGGDPCSGLRKQLAEHQRKLREYIADPLKGDNKGFLADALAAGDQALYNKIYSWRIHVLERQIAGFMKQLADCEKKNGL